MKKVVTMHLAGKLFQIEEDAYQKLDRTLVQLRLKNPTSCESTEAKLAELFQTRIELGQKVITFQMVYEVLRDQDLLNTGNGQENKEPYKRLYRQTKDKVLGGVCSGLGVYWNVDPVLFRLLFILLFFGFGTGLLLYLVMWIVVPSTD